MDCSPGPAGRQSTGGEEDDRIEDREASWKGGCLGTYTRNRHTAGGRASGHYEVKATELGDMALSSPGENTERPRECTCGVDSVVIGKLGVADRGRQSGSPGTVAVLTHAEKRAAGNKERGNDKQGGTTTAESRQRATPKRDRSTGNPVGASCSLRRLSLGQ